MKFKIGILIGLLAIGIVTLDPEGTHKRFARAASVVTSVLLDYATANSIKFYWQSPSGFYSYLEITCKRANGTVDDGFNISHSIFEAECKNLVPSTLYAINIVTVAVDLNGTVSKAILTVFLNTVNMPSLTTLTLNELTKVNFTSYTSSEIIDILVQLKTNLSSLRGNGSDTNYFLNQTSTILQNIAQRQTQSEKQDFVLPFVKLIDDLMKESGQVFSQNEDSSDKLSTSLEIITNKLDLESKSNFSQEFDNFFVKTQLLNDSTIDFDIGFSKTPQEIKPVINVEPSSVDYFLKIDDLKYAAFFDKKVIQNLIQEKKSARLTYVGYATSKLFNGRESENIEETQVDCVSKSLIGPNVISVSRLEGLDAIQDFVYLVYEEQRNQKYCDKRKVNYTFECVYWDYEKNDWDKKGCKHLLVEKDDKILHKCSCNHTTNFALLMVSDKIQFCEWCETVLFYVSVVGCSISMMALLATIIIDLIIKFGVQKERSVMQQDTTQIITIWSFILLFMNAVYMAFSFFKATDVDTNESQRASCIAIGVMLHYSLICSFCFSFCVSFFFMLKVYKPLKIFRFKTIASVIFSIVVSGIVVGIVIGIDRSAYINPNKYCWLHSNYALYGAIVPIGVILLLNLIIFLAIVIFYSNFKLIISEHSEKSNSIKSHLKFVFACFVNSGLTWLFGFLVTLPLSDSLVYARFSFALVFSILNSLQGFVMFVTYNLVSNDKRKYLNEYKRLINEQKRRRNFQNQIRRRYVRRAESEA